MSGSRIELSGPLAGHAAGFLEELRRDGYTASPRKKHLYLVVYLSRWLDEQGLSTADVTTPLVEPFFEARRARGVANLRTRQSLAPLIAYLRGIGALAEPDAPTPTDAPSRLLDAFGTYLTHERGLVTGT